MFLQRSVRVIPALQMIDDGALPSCRGDIKNLRTQSAHFIRTAAFDFRILLFLFWII